MNSGYEIERKFLVKLPDITKLNVNKQAAMVQTYLNSIDKNSQRRVRRIDFGDRVKYTYTEKAFISAIVRKELEYDIDESEYKRLLGQANPEYVPIHKKRYRFEYLSQQFELDVYPFSDELAILELELENEDQDIIFPDYIETVAEVTGDDRYSNASLANAGAFPEKFNVGLE